MCQVIIIFVMGLIIFVGWTRLYHAPVSIYIEVIRKS